jgi:hypothetical protein
MMRWHIPREYKDLALHMSINEGVSDSKILSYIGINARAMRHLQQTYCETGETIWTPVIQGQPHLLDMLDALMRYLFLSVFLCS